MIVRIEQRMLTQLAAAVRDRLLEEHFKQWFQTQLSQPSEHDQRWMGIVSHLETEVKENATK